MGHYFGLEHIWGPQDDSFCDEDDGISDTPAQYEDSFDCPNFPYTDDCTTSGNGIMFMNYMDYSDDACMSMFTEGQKARMLAVLNNDRSGLLDMVGCNSPVFTKDLEKEFFQIFPNPSTDKFELSIEQLEGKTKHLRIYNLNGQLVKEQILENNTTKKRVDISHLKNGVHFIEIQTDDVFLYSKFMILR